MRKFIIFLRILFIFGLNNWIWIENCAVSAERRLAEEKCEEYADSLKTKIFMDLMMKTKPIPVLLDCPPSVSTLILGGKIAQKNEFPHMVGIGWMSRDGKKEILYKCAGSLISNEWVLTAAHCTHGSLGTPRFVRLGNGDLVKPSNQTKVVEIRDIRRHPRYKPPALYADIALLRLSKPLDRFGEFVKPACLYSKYNTSPKKVWATGWGNMDDDPVGGPRMPLKKVALDVVDNFNCHRMYNNSVVALRGVVPSMMCAGDPHGGWKEDTCVGDSGGPLQVIHPSNCVYRIVGITSFGKLCASNNSPGVYTRVSHYLDWIEPIVWRRRT